MTSIGRPGVDRISDLIDWLKCYGVADRIIVGDYTLYDLIVDLNEIEANIPDEDYD